MSGRAQLMWDDGVTGYDFGPGHPMDPVRLKLTRSLVVDVVPRNWTHLTAIAAGEPIAPEAQTPQEWRFAVYRLARQTAPLRMTDGCKPVWRGFEEAGYDPADRLDQAVLATRRAVFPLHGLLSLDPPP